jgi:hypothetical protein
MTDCPTARVPIHHHAMGVHNCWLVADTFSGGTGLHSD